MNAQLKDVNTDSSTVNKDVKSDSSPAQPDVTQVTPIDANNPPQVGQPEILLDEMGVPLQNRAKEFQRVNEKLHGEVSDLKKTVDEIQKTQKSQKETPYTPEQLREIVATRPDLKDAAMEELRKLDQNNFEKKVLTKVEGIITKEKEADQFNIARSSAYSKTIETFPDVFVKNANGVVIGLNNNSAQANEMGRIYLQSPELKNNPNGILLAAELAHSRISRGAVNTQKETNNQLKQQNLQLKNQTLTEGGGVVQEPDSDLDVHKKKVKKATDSGKVADAVDAVKSALIKGGILG